MQDSDESLLKSFAAHRDEATFRALANRYLGLIFHTSLRRTSSRQIAEEVSQNILCALAKKASFLARNPERLAAWLHRATLFESSKAMRSESSYQRRKALRHPDETAATRPPESQRWADAVPHLDPALDQLSETDRQILLLHYFEKLSYPRIASRLGKSPEAVKKQSQRAMDKLARILRARGVPLSLAVIATGLTGEFAKGAPLTLIQSAAAAAFASHTTHSTTALTVMFASKSKLVVPIAILLCAMPIGIQQIAISNAADHNESLRSQFASAGKPRPESTAVRTAASTARIHGLSTSTDIMVLVDEYDEARRSEGIVISSRNQRIMRFKEKLAAFDTDTLVRLIQECAGLRVQLSKKSHAFDVLLEELGNRDPGLAVRIGTAAIENEQRMAPAIRKISRFLAAWAQSDPEASWVWLQSTQETAALNRPFQSSQRPIDWLRAPVAASLLQIQSPNLRELFHEIPEDDRGRVIKLLISTRFMEKNTDSTKQAQWALKCTEVINELSADEDRDENLISLLNGPNCDQLVRDLDTSKMFLLNGQLDQEAILPLLRTVTFRALQEGGADSTINAKKAKLREWLDELSPVTGSSILDEVLNQNADRQIKLLEQNETYTDDSVLRTLTSPSASFKLHLPAALKLAERIEDPAKRAAAIEHLNKP